MSSDIIISVEHLSKRYRLGQIGATTLRESAERLWHRVRGRDPAEHMGQIGVSGSRSVGVTESRSGEKIGDKVSPSDSDTPIPPNSDTSSSPDNDLWALRDVSFEVRRGEVLGIIGRNGAGKSTLLKILSRITEPTSGRAILRGRVGSLLEVGTGFHPELTGRENIYLNGAILGMRKREITAKFDEIVAFAEVERFIDTPVKRYSSGMYVRLAFAVAAHLDPEILLVDEVLAVGDLAFQKKCLGKMGEVARGGRTVLFVSHNMAAINRICPRSILLKKGTLGMFGNTDVVIGDYVGAVRENVAERKWRDLANAPGTGKTKLRAVRLLDKDGKLSSTLDGRCPFCFQVEYQVFSEISGARIGFRVATGDGTVIFTGATSELGSGQGHRLEPGIYSTCCDIPGHLLNKGQFVVHNVWMDQPFVEVFWLEENVISFHVERLDAGSQLNEAWTGLVLPELTWHTIANRSPNDAVEG